MQGSRAESAFARSVRKLIVLYFYDFRRRIMRESRKVLSEGVQISQPFYFFGSMRGGRIQRPLLAGHQKPASETPF